MWSIITINPHLSNTIHFRVPYEAYDREGEVQNDDQIVFGWGEIAPEVFKSLLNSDAESGYANPL
jgi:hypothetical protein